MLVNTEKLGCGNSKCNTYTMIDNDINDVQRTKLYSYEYDKIINLFVTTVFRKLIYRNLCFGKKKL